MEAKDIKKTRTLLQSSENIVITCHKGPDGDAIGSSLALYLYLKKQGKKAMIIVPDDFPFF